MFVGIDVSKAWLDSAQLTTNGQHTQLKRCGNRPEGVTKLIEQLKDARLVVCEATGGYEQILVDALLKAGIAVSVVNPKRVRDFARSAGKLAKTDRIDAEILASYARVFENKLPRAVLHEYPELKQLHAVRQDIIDSLTQAKNRLNQAMDSTKALLQETVTHFQKQLKTVNASIATQLKAHPHAHVLSPITGVGPILNTALLATLPELGYLNGKEIAALVGLAPFNCDSGQMRGKRRVWGGRQRLRNTLYMATFSAKKHHPVIQSYFDALIARGKPFKVAMVACMRKFIVILNAKMRDHLAGKISQTSHS
jgi:transposase